MSETGALRVLLLEDRDDDALLVSRFLQKEGFQASFQRVKSRAQLEELPPEATFEVILCDYRIPGLDGLESLAILQAKWPKVPCIVLSGQIGEEQAADALRLGARDFVSKDHLTRLGPAIRRELQEATDRLERDQLEQHRLQLEIQLRHAQKLESIGQLAAGIAHEINTPTQFIGDNTAFVRDCIADLLALLDTVQNTLGNPDARTDATEIEALRVRMKALDLPYLQTEIPKALEQTLDGVARVSRIVSAMKDFSHPGTTGLVHTDLNRSIESTLTVSRNEWKYVAEVEVDFDPKLPATPCYPSEFNQVILNLIVNAAQAIEAALGGRESGRMGRIRVSTAKEGHFAVVRISDTGTGIPATIRDRIFDPFFTTKEVGKGTGQGLAIARAVIVDRHGGRIATEALEGFATTFVIHLPLLDSPGAA